MTIRNTLRTLSALALTAAFLPGCDGEDYEALGLSAEQIDNMSEEELDELAELEDEDQLDIAAVPEKPEIVTDFASPNTGDAEGAGLADKFWDPRYTHTAEDAGLADSFWDPRYTHTAEDAGLADSFWDPRYTHVTTVAPLVGPMGNPLRPTHAAPLPLPVRPEPPGGCQPDSPDPVFSNG